MMLLSYDYALDDGFDLEPSPVKRAWWKRWRDHRRARSATLLIDASIADYVQELLEQQAPARPSPGPPAQKIREPLFLPPIGPAPVPPPAPYAPSPYRHYTRRDF